MSLRILIAEDDRHTRRILEHIFTKDPAFADHPVELFQAPDGEEALKIFEKENPDLVISDLLMPRMDGFALCRNIRKSPKGKSVPLIVTSAIYKETALLNKMREELRVEFFAKPFQVRELVRGVQRMLEQHFRDREGRKAKKPAEMERFKPQIAPEPPTSGDLRSRGLAALIFDINEAQATGVLLLRRGRVKKQIYFILGHPAGAESNVRNETMGHYMVVKQILDENRHQKLLATARREKIGVMEALVQLGWMSETDVLRHHTALVKLRIINSLRWREGQFEFTPGDTFSDRMPKCAIDPITIALLGLKRLTNPDEVASLLERDTHRPIRLTPRGERFRDVFAKIFGDQFLSAAQSQPSLGKLMATGLDPLLMYTHVYALLQTGMAELGEGEPEPAQRALRSEDPLALEQLKQQAVREETEPDQREVLHQELFGVDEISVVTTIPLPQSSRVDSSEDPAVVEIPISVEMEPGPAEPEFGLTAEEARQLVVSTYLGIHKKNYYEILGVSDDAQEAQIRQAYKKITTKFDVEAFSRLDLGTDHPKLEEMLHLFHQACHVLTDPSLRADYDRRLKAQSRTERFDPLEAELLFREGEQRMKQGRFKEARDSFDQALAIDPETSDTHSHLAWAIYQGGGKQSANLDEVWSHLNQALAIDPDLVSAHLHAGQIHSKVGAFQEASEHLEKVLDLDPSNEEAFVSLSSLLEDRGDWKILERLHRKVLHRLGSRFPDWTLRLWKSLAEVYKARLANPDSARVCLEIAAKLKPDDEEVQQQLQALREPKAVDWRDRRQTLLGQFEAAPNRPEPLEELFKTTISQDHYDAAYLCSSALAVSGSPFAEAAEFHRRYKPPFLQRARSICDASVWQNIRHEDDDPATGQIFEVLAELPTDLELGFDRKGKPSGEKVDLSAHTEHFGRVLEYLCHQLQLPVPGVWVRPDLKGHRAKLSNALTPDLVVSSSLLEETNHVRLAAVLGQTLPFFWAGRSFGALHSRRELKSLVMAAMLLVAPKLKVSDPDGKISALTDRLQTIPQGLRQRVSETILALTKQRSTLNVGRWCTALFKSAERLAVTLAGDLVPVIEAIPEDRRSSSTVELVKFALSDAHLEVREQLGLSIAV